MHLQPILDLHRREITCAEALVRCPGLPANVFVDALESAGLVDDLLDVVLDLALREQHDLALAGTPIDIAVNMSATSLRTDLVGRVDRALDRHGVHAAHLHLELTESAPINDVDIAASALEGLRRLGVQIALDDYGMGWSSLARVRRLPLDAVKLDRSFVADLDLVAIRATAELGRASGLRLIAEGLECPKLLPRLEALGFDAVQGYAIGRPVAPDVFRNMLQRGQGASRFGSAA